MTPDLTVGERSVLVVDDEPRIRENLAVLLRGNVSRVETAPHGQAAIAAMGSKQFDLVITDINMDAGDGFSLLEWIRENAPATLVIVITGYASMESTIRAMRMGAFDYLIKPFDFELLSISVERALSRIEEERARERAQAELKTWSRHLTAVNSLARRATGTLTESALLHMVARALHDEFGFYHVYFAMVEAGRLVIRGQAGAYEGEMPEGYRYEAGTGITGKAIRSRGPVLVDDVSRDVDYVALMPQTRSQVALPIRVDDQVIGALSVESAEPSAFGPQELLLLQTLLDIAASAIKTARLFHQVKETKDRLEALIDSSADAIVTTDTKGIVTFFSPGAEGVYGYSAAEVVGQPVANYYADGAVEAAKIMHLLGQHERLKNYDTVLLGRDGRRIFASISASLLKDRSGKTVGTLGVSKDVTQRVELERKLKELTITDSLTGLYNQGYFHRKLSAEMERARRQGRDLTLILFDLDHFKQYNDSHGHLEGDKLLRQVGALTQNAIRALVDAAFRYGGDEFTVLFPELGGEQARTVVTRIKRRIEDGLPDEVRLSMGLVSCRPEISAEEFVRLADEAMYEAKSRRDGKIVCR